MENNVNNNNWNEFKKYFENVHPNFFTELTKKHNNLSQNDLKICAFIKLNMSSKEIAQILNVNNKTVDIARYRLRKKMNLDKEDNLYKIISEILL